MLVGDAFILGIISCACLFEVRRTCRFAYILSDYRHNPGYGARIKRRYWEKYCAIRTLPSIACVSLRYAAGIETYGIRFRASISTSFRIPFRRSSIMKFFYLDFKIVNQRLAYSEYRILWLVPYESLSKLRERVSARAPPREILKYDPLRASRLILTYDSFARWRDTRWTRDERITGGTTRVLKCAQISGFYIAIPISESDDPSLLRYTMNPVGTTWISRPEFRLRDTRREIRYGPIYRKLSGRREGRSVNEFNQTNERFDVHKMTCWSKQITNAMKE